MNPRSQLQICIEIGLTRFLVTHTAAPGKRCQIHRSEPLFSRMRCPSSHQIRKAADCKRTEGHQIGLISASHGQSKSFFDCSSYLELSSPPSTRLHSQRVIQNSRDISKHDDENTLPPERVDALTSFREVLCTWWNEYIKPGKERHTRSAPHKHQKSQKCRWTLVGMSSNSLDSANVLIQ